MSSKWEMGPITKELTREEKIEHLLDRGYSREQLEIYESSGEDRLSIDQLYIIEKYREEHPEEEAPDFFDPRGKFLHNVMGDYLTQKLNVCKINGALHIYDNGVYRPGEDTLHGYMLKLCPTLSDARRREVYKYIKVSLKTPTREVSPPELIPFKTRIYDIRNDTFLRYSPQYVFLNRFPYDYIPDAPPVDLVDNTLIAISNYDTRVIDLILEAFGNCYYLLNAYRGTVFLYGPAGNNGKSTLLNMLLQMMGKDNCSFLTLQDMAERFRLIGIYGKAVNICDDNGDGHVADSSFFKRVSTGGVVTAERKGQDAIAFTPFCKAFFALNSLPPVSDKSKAFFSRLLLIPLNADFSQTQDKDVSLKDRKWTDAEMQYLTRLSIEGLKRLMKKGDFTRPDCVNAALARYETENNPALGFIEEHEHDIIGRPTDEGYMQFVSWCRENGYKPFNKPKFSRELSGKCNIQTQPRRIDGYTEAVRCYVYQ